MNDEENDNLPEAPDMNRLVGQRLRAIRKARGCSQETLAKVLGISAQQMQKHEKGINRIGANRLLQMANYLRVPISSFFDTEPVLLSVQGLSEKFIIALDDVMGLADAANENLHKLNRNVREMRKVRDDLIKFWPRG